MDVPWPPKCPELSSTDVLIRDTQGVEYAILKKVKINIPFEMELSQLLSKSSIWEEGQQKYAMLVATHFVYLSGNFLRNLTCSQVVKSSRGLSNPVVKRGQI